MYMTSAVNPQTQNSTLLGYRISGRKLVSYLCVKSVVLVFVLKMRFFGHVLYSAGIQESLSNLYSLKNNNPKNKVYLLICKFNSQ